MSKTKGNKIKIVDLFSGVGGLTFGFQYKKSGYKFVKNSNFDILFANDFDEMTAKAFSKNFPKIKMFNESIEKINEEFLTNNNINFENVDLVIGGPPCQSYSTVGKRLNDGRSKMYIEYRRILKLIQPRMFIFENVLGILSFKIEKEKKIIEVIIKEFNELGYNVEMKILNAKDYGVPQNRLRVFLVGTKREQNLKWSFPKPSVKSELTLEDAISDLPPLNQSENKNFYENEHKTKYQKLMRYKSSGLTNHSCGWYGDRMTRIISSLDDGESLIDINRKVSEGELSEDLFLTSGYNNAYGRLWWNKPSSTITNNFGTPSSIRCIHPVDDRALSPREAARIQSFPDTYIFLGSKAQISSQIGNAVPPLLAIALANEVVKTLGGSKNGK